MLSDAPAVARQPPHLQTNSPSAANGHGVEPNTVNPGSRPPPGVNAGNDAPHTRDGSVTRGRTVVGAAGQGGNTIPPSNATHRAASAQRAQQDHFHGRAVQVDTGLHRRASNNYGHHRQTSVIHGVQHSRNPSFNSPVTVSPLSPESLHNAGLRIAANMRRTQATAYDPSLATPLTPASAHSQSQSIDSSLAAEPSPDAATTHSRRRNGASRSRRGHAHGSSMGNQHAESRTPGEFALYHLFHSFVVRADQKINLCLANLDMLSAPVEQICGKGADASFDQLISALGHICRQDPKPLVDSLMLWRKGKADTASAYKKQMPHNRPHQGNGNLPHALPRRHTEPVGLDPASPQAFPGSAPAPVEEGSDEYMLADRRATVSVYILCRVLMEIFEQSSLVSITPELAMKLEDILFAQLREVEPTQVLQSRIRMANWRIYGELLGQMSRLDFGHVTRRFLDQLDSWQQEIARSTGTTGARDLEMRVELLLLSMRNLHVSVDANAVYATCDFFKSLANLFIAAHGPTIKQTYCNTLEKLLLQIADEPERLQHVSRLREFSDIINSRLTQMLPKVRHWASAVPVSTLILCLAPIDIFAAQWSQTISNLSQKLRDRSTRTPAMRAICQLLWAYLRRSQDQVLVKARKVEDVIKIAFPAGKKAHVSIEPSIAEALVCFVRIVGSNFPDICFRGLIFPLINSDLFQSTKDLKIEQMEPEKMVIGIRSFLAVMADLERETDGRSTFPTFSTAPPPSETTPMSPTTSKAALSTDVSPPPDKVVENVSSAPVNVSVLDEQTRKRYLQFCEILGKITILCDQAFGSSAVLNEKFATSPNMHAPKTPLVEAFALNRREELGVSDQKQSYYDLLHVAIQALPRCFSDHIPLNSLINLLCTGSAHMQVQLASSAAQSLKAIARQGYAQAVATAFPRFIFQYDSQYSTMSDEGRLGPAHIETTLTLYLELLQIWTEQLRQKAQSTAADSRDRNGSGQSRAVQMEITNAVSLVDEMEAYGLFFLCSQSRRVRAFAVKVLRLVLQFDQVLGQEESARVITILENKSAEILDLDNNDLTVAERIRLQKDKRRSGSRNTLIDICSSEVTYDSTLWFKGFPNLIRYVFEVCPNAVALSRVVVCDRLALMQPDVEKMAASGSAADFRLLGRSAATPAEALFDQWKLYLIMACVTLSSPGAQSQSQLANAVHVRKASRNAGSMQEKLSSARALFSAMIPMLGAGPDAIRSAIVVALGSVNRKLYRTLLESLQYAVIRCNDEAKSRLGTHQRTPSSPQRSQMTDRMRTEVTHIYKLTATFLRHDDVVEDEWVLNNLINYTRDLRIFLNDTDIQSDWRYLKIRFHYCGLIEELYTSINRLSSSARWMPFESRKSAFGLMEEWCGFAPEQSVGARHEDGGNLGASREVNERTNQSAATEKEKSNLRLAALGAMAALCAGPVSVVTETNTLLQFNLLRMLSWIDTIFGTTNDKVHAIGQKALRLLLLYNSDHPQIIEHAIQQCYGARSPQALHSYFSVVTDVLMQQTDYPVALPRILGAVMFTLGNDNREIRMKSARLLRILDDRQQKSSNLQEFDISISDKTRAVYRLAQFEYSKRLANAHPELGFGIFSEFSLQFRRVSTDHQRNMVAAILPWLQTLELQVEPSSNTPTPVSYMLLSNMLEITIRFSGTLHNEVQALWQALATGPHAGNVQLVLDFIINLSLDRREQNFVEYAKQIVVYLSATPAGSRVLEFLLMQLVPKNMINEKKNAELPAVDMAGLPYVADLSTVLPVGHKQAGLSLGQVSLIFLVDLMVPPVTLRKGDAIKLVHAVLILWDHYTMVVQEHAREMLVHLIHELVTTKIEETTLKKHQALIEGIVEAVRNNDPSVTWTYEDHTGKDDAEDTKNRVPSAMTHLIDQIVTIFGLSFEGFSDLWAKEGLHWASICPVRHLACRSFQVFRSISVTLDARMLADMLARLSNTIADEQSDYQTFSLEILTTLRVIIGSLETRTLLKYPQLFWTTCACLNTIHEREFFESLGMLEKILARLDLADPQVIEILLRGKPAKWEGVFDGLQTLIYKGLRSADCLDRTLALLHRFAGFPDNELIGPRERLLFNVLANLPFLLQQFDADNSESDAGIYADGIAEVAQTHGVMPIAACLSKYLAGNFASSQAFLTETMNAIKTSYLPKFDAPALIFLIGLLTNQTSWFRVRVMDMLCQLITLVDMRNPAITSHGPDLISPLLRLLQTEHCNQALEVMDYVMEVSVTPMDNDHLRMSMTSGSARAIRKEYERTQSLYGIPMPSGWSIPMPAVHSNLTRNNVHAVFYTCGDVDLSNEKTINTPDVEFSTDDGYPESYFPGDTQTDSIRTDAATETNMGDLVNTLDSLDDFFDDPENAATPTAADQHNMPTYFGSSMLESDTSMYDEHTAPILSRTLARTSSSLSVQNGLAESRPSTSHQHRNNASFSSGGYSMQTSFSSIDELSGPGPSMTVQSKKAVSNMPPLLNTAPAVAIRPGLHARSITSPANQFAASHPTSAGFVPTLPTVSSLQSASITDGTFFNDDSWSDSENAPFPALTTTFSNPAKNSSSPGYNPSPVAQHTNSYSTSATSNVPQPIESAGLSSFRRGMRRLTGGKSESAREREKSRLRGLSSGGTQNQQQAQQGGMNGAAGSGGGSGHNMSSSGMNNLAISSGSTSIAASLSPKVPRVPAEYLTSTANMNTTNNSNVSNTPQQTAFTSTPSVATNNNTMTFSGPNGAGTGTDMGTTGTSTGTGPGPGPGAQGYSMSGPGPAESTSSDMI